MGTNGDNSITATTSQAIIRETRVNLAPALPQSLCQRIGQDHVRKRLTMEDMGEQPAFTGTSVLNSIESSLFSARVLARVLKICGLYARGRRNARNIQVSELTHKLPTLAADLQGYTLLHMSDLHIDIAPDFVDVVIGRMKQLHYDVVVLTGDYRFRTSGSGNEAVIAMKKLASHFDAPSFAVLGNHDSIYMVAELEGAGIQVLMNESECLAEHLYVSGVDDPHYFKCDDLSRAISRAPEDATRILLAHSPEIYEEANQANMDLLLCGHTHGGQIRLPGGFPVTLNADCPRRYGSGVWKHGDLRGYTSNGTGSSLLDVRFNCLPEIALHRLVR